MNCFGRRFLESDWIVPKNGGFEVDNWADVKNKKLLKNIKNS